MYVKLLLTMGARRMQTAYILSKNDSSLLPEVAYNLVGRLFVLKTCKDQI